MKYALVASLVLMGGCVSQDRVHTFYDEQGRQLSAVHTGADANGTPMITLVGQFDRGNQFHPLYGGVGEDYFAGFVKGGLAGAFEGAGLAGFGALVRPATTVFKNVGNSNSQSAGGVARATGGRANASLNANLSNQQSQHQRATATSDASARTGPVNSSSTSNGGGIIPNGTVLHTPSGDVTVDPTVNVFQ